MKRLAVLLTFVWGAALAQHQHQHHNAHKPADGSTIGVISLDVYADGGTLHLLTGDQQGEATALLYRRSADGGATWSAPAKLPGPPPRALRRGDDAQVAARGDTVIALWSVPGTGWGGSGPFASAISTDAGRTWRPGRTPSDSGLTTGHGFADLIADDGGFHAVWLDGRDKAQGLRYARSADGSTWSPNTTIAAKTCECCWNTLFMHRDALHVLYRAGHPRDMELAVLEKSSRWVRQGAVADFKWHVKGCPETGGALAATPDGALHAIAWTGKPEAMGLYAVTSRDSWSVPRRLGTSDAQHGDLAALGSVLAAVWDQEGGIFAALSRDSGKIWEEQVRLDEKAGALNPRVVAAEDGFLVFWTADGKSGRREVRSARLRLR